MADRQTAGPGTTELRDQRHEDPSTVRSTQKTRPVMSRSHEGSNKYVLWQLGKSGMVQDLTQRPVPVLPRQERQRWQGAWLAHSPVASSVHGDQRSEPEFSSRNSNDAASTPSLLVQVFLSWTASQDKKRNKSGHQANSRGTPKRIERKHLRLDWTLS